MSVINFPEIRASWMTDEWLETQTQQLESIVDETENALEKMQDEKMLPADRKRVTASHRNVLTEAKRGLAAVNKLARQTLTEAEY